MPKDVASKQTTIVNSRGLHARAAVKLVKVADLFQSSIEVCRGHQCVPATSILGLITLGAAIGTQVIIRAEGPDATRSVEMIAELIDRGFDEDA